MNSPIPSLRPGEVVLLVGQQGCGKSHAAANLARKWINEHGGRLYLCDPMQCMGPLAADAGILPLRVAQDPDWWPKETDGRPLLVLIDEIHNVAGSRSGCPPWVRKLAAQARHLNLTLLGTSQHPGQVHKDLREVCTKVYASTVRGPEALGFFHSGGMPYPDPPPQLREFVRVR